MDGSDRWLKWVCHRHGGHHAPTYLLSSPEALALPRELQGCHQWVVISTTARSPWLRWRRGEEATQHLGHSYDELGTSVTVAGSPKSHPAAVRNLGNLGCVISEWLVPACLVVGPYLPLVLQVELDRPPLHFSRLSICRTRLLSWWLRWRPPLHC